MHRHTFHLSRIRNHSRLKNGSYRPLAASMDRLLLHACAYYIISYIDYVILCYVMLCCSSGTCWVKISQPGDWPVPTFHSLREIHNQGGETTLHGRSEPFFFLKFTKSNPTWPRGVMLCYVMLCYVMLCYDMLCCVM